MTALISLIHSRYLLKIRFEMKEFYIFSRKFIDAGCKHYLNLQVGPLLRVPIIIRCEFSNALLELLQRHIYQQIVGELLSRWNTG